ncbi:DUF262 domain-containing protein [Leucothrix sargassi]|nr:DUF262 domain-containing protein [Leucothrix sargassi]
MTEDIQQIVETQELTLRHIFEHKFLFNIPSYQRPYVWPEGDVEKLINDIYKAWVARDENYFIGTVLTSIQKDDKDQLVYELIDGQQRTTTLMLIALAFRKAGVDSKLSYVATIDTQPRLQFSVRDQVQQLLGHWAGLEDYDFPGHDAVDNDLYLKLVNAALTVLEQWVDKLSEDKRLPFADYIFKSVQWVNNTVPNEMDLNRLFSTMNTTGVQLEQADILKSKLLKQIKNDKHVFDAIWLACEHMDNYFERNLRKVFPNAQWDEVTSEKQLADFHRFPHNSSKHTQSSEGLTIAQLAEMSMADFIDEDKEEKSKVGKIEKEKVFCRSIIGFSLLLIHAYRVYLALHPDKQSDIVPRVRKEKLLETFKPLTHASESEVKRFIETLWQVRYQFDRQVIKWVARSDSDEEHLSLTALNFTEAKKKTQIQRSQKAPDALTMLQSVCYFTGDRNAQYWLTPLIAGLIRGDNLGTKETTQLMERIDNELSLAKETQKDSSFRQARQKKVEVESWSSQCNVLKESRGTRFEHYWFQKLEYLLWKQFKNDSAINDEKAFKNYRITSKNSVEHVHPQREEHGVVLQKELLDSFGNLVLLSPSENSSYSNQNVKKKMVDFEKKKQYDSLKLKAIYDLSAKGEHWGKSQIKQHRKAMMKILTDHYKGVHGEEK